MGSIGSQRERKNAPVNYDGARRPDADYRVGKSLFAHGRDDAREAV
jgi:hypothetical protein